MSSGSAVKKGGIIFLKTVSTINGPELCGSCTKCGNGCDSKPESIVNGCLDYERKLVINLKYLCNSCANADSCSRAGTIPDAGYDCTDWKSNLLVGLGSVTSDKKDEVNHPDHYTQGGIECIDCIRASMPPEGFQDYCKGNVIKYIHRWRFKGGVQDLHKAEVYLKWLIESAEKEEKNI